MDSDRGDASSDDVPIPVCSGFVRRADLRGAVENAGRAASSILAARPCGSLVPAGLQTGHLHREAHLPAQRPTPQAQARLSRAHVVERRTRDPEAPPREGSQAPLRLSATTVERRYRLSRSRDFDAVYRQGRSVSTRYLTLHWFPREDDPDGVPRLGLAVPKSVGTAVARNRIKRQLRETWRRPRPRRPAPGYDYVLVARPGIAEPAESRGGEWLAEQVSDVLRKGRGVTGLGSIGVAAVWAWRHTLGVLTPAGHLQVPPELLPVRESTPSASTGCCAAPCCRAGACSAATRGRTAGSTTCATRRSSGARGASGDRRRDPDAARERPHDGPRVVPQHGGPAVGVVDRRARRRGAHPARAGHGAPDPLDAEPPGARAGDEGDPAALEARPAAAERGADEVLPGEQDQPGRIVPADPVPVPDLHRALLHAAGLREGRRERAEVRRATASTSSGWSTSPSRRSTPGDRCCS